MKPLISSTSAQGAVTVTESGDLSLNESAEITDSAGTSLDPLDQIADVFRDLDEFRVNNKAERSSLRGTMKLAEALSESRAPQAEPQSIRSGFLSKSNSRNAWWRRAVSPPELIFSIGFSVFIIFITALIRSP